MVNQNPVSADDFTYFGLLIMDRHDRYTDSTLINRFRYWFGTSPTITAITWSRLIESGWTNYSGVREAKPKYLLWALLFLKSYGTEAVLSAMVDADEKTFRKWAWFYVEGIATLHSSTIFWNRRFLGDTFQRCLVSVDGTDFRIQEPKPFSSKWYSHKFKGPGLRYEIGIAISTGHIVSFHGPFPCGEFPDRKIFQLGMRNHLGPTEKVIADDGYRGDTKVCTKHDARDEQHRQVMGRIRARHETINRRLKTWKSLQSVFRHNRDKHHLVFESVLVLEQLAIENGHEPFQVHNYFDSPFV